MRLPANPLDFLIVQIDPEGSEVAADALTADLLTGDGASIPAIGTGRWIPALAVACDDPDLVRLADLRDGDWIIITDVTDDTITFTRTETARVILPGEYLFFSLGSFEYSVLLDKLEALEEFIVKLAGNYDGIPRHSTNGAPDELLVEATDPVSMQVTVNPGVATISTEVFRLAASETLAAFEAPSANPRIDLIQAQLGRDGEADSISIKTGSEAGSPTCPTVDTDCMALAEVYHRVGETSIKNTDDATNGYLTDRRQRL